MTTACKNQPVGLEYLSLIAGLGTLASAARNTVYLDTPNRDELLFLCSIVCTLVLLYGLESRVQLQLKTLKFRKNCSPGLWTCCLLPIALILLIYHDEKEISIQNQRSDFLFKIKLKHRNQIQSKDWTTLKWMWYLTSLCTFVSSLYVISALCGASKPKKVFRSSMNTFYCLFLISIGFVMMYTLAEIELRTSLYLSAISQVVFFYLAMSLPELFPRSFSFGEVLIISQTISSFVATSTYHIFQHLNSHEILSQYEQILLFTEISLLGTIFVVILFVAAKFFFGPSLFLILISLTFAGFVFVLPLLRFVLRVNPFIWCFNFLVESNTRLSLLGLWSVLLLMTGLYVYSQSLLPNKPTTIMRKYFHLMIIGVYFPGLLFDPVILRFSSALLLGVAVIIEFIRFCEVKPISDVINRNFSFFLDEKDQGPLILTHIYLLVGCSSPIWFCTKGIESFAGILSVGIGDAFASVGGKIFGRHKWPGSDKTIEGTALSICSQLLTINVLEKTGVFPVNTTSALVGVVISTSLLEAFTSQVDNLVVSLVFFMLLVPVVRMNELK